MQDIPRRLLTPLGPISMRFKANESSVVSPCAKRPTLCVRPSGWRANASALDDVHRESAAGGLLVLGLHIGTGLAHGLYNLVERHVMRAVTAQRNA